nr:alpha/beta hydrolase-fold protein [Pseudomaricurvus alkylphenolicus]
MLSNTSQLAAGEHLACREDSPLNTASDCVTPISTLKDPARRLEISKQARKRYLINLIVDNRNGDYRWGPESSRGKDVPKGTVKQYEWNTSGIFPNTHRNYWVYVPAQYRSDEPAALMVFQDGDRFLNETNMPTLAVMENLIHKGEMPVTIAVFVEPGRPQGNVQATTIRSSQRQIEYDKQNDHYARLLLEEILPEVRRSYNISDDPRMRAIGGASSGAMAAWNVAWQRPDAFGNVVSFIGSYTDIHGGHNVPMNVRRHPTKPIRVFMQSGLYDFQLEFGDWALANQSMASALAYAGYDYRFVFGDGGHDTQHAAAILADAFRWIWKAN